MYDVITDIGYSKIQHGKYNNRIYLIKVSEKDFPGIIGELDKLALEKGYSKIFAKVPARLSEEFKNSGYVTEALIPGFFNYKEDVFFMGKYFSVERKQDSRSEEMSKVLEISRSKEAVSGIVSLDRSFEWGTCGYSDAEEMAEIYKNVFETYPFPIHDPVYIKRTMDSNVIYFNIRYAGRIVALSSSEMDIEANNVEMTDFATLNEFRGKGFALFLLQVMEKEMNARAVRTAYTIARALSYGMNVTFIKAGYSYGGTLINNTNISGKMESMNVWYKAL